MCKAACFVMLKRPWLCCAMLWPLPQDLHTQEIVDAIVTRLRQSCHCRCNLRCLILQMATFVFPGALLAFWSPWLWDHSLSPLLMNTDKHTKDMPLFAPQPVFACGGCFFGSSLLSACEACQSKWAIWCNAVVLTDQNSRCMAGVSLQGQSKCATWCDMAVLTDQVSRCMQVWELQQPRDSQPQTACRSGWWLQVSSIFSLQPMSRMSWQQLLQDQMTK